MRPLFRFFLLCFVLLGVCGALPAGAGERAVQTRGFGELPVRGRVVIRTGLAWLGEKDPVFVSIANRLEQRLARRGLLVTPVGPSTLAPLPPMPKASSTARGSGVSSPQKSRASLRGRDPAPAEPAMQEKAAELARSGKLPQVSLRGYAAPKKDAELPASVRAVRPPDVQRRLEALSQIRGAPVSATAAIPLRMPPELADDAAKAEYAILIRFAEANLRADAVPSFFPGRVYAQNDFPLSGVLVAASSIGGVGALGIPPPASPSATRREGYGTPGGFRRGYEGAAPNDFWHRDHDFFQRDYQFKHGDPPAYATPPEHFATPGTARRASGRVAPPAPGVTPLPGLTQHVLIMECFDLIPMRSGKKPVPVWFSEARMPGGGMRIYQVLPALLDAALQ